MKIEMHEGVVTLSGAITQNLWPVLAPVVKLQLKQHHQGVVIDCHAIQQFNTEGSITLLEAARYVQLEHGQAILANAPPCVLEILSQTSEIAHLLPLAWTVKEARERLNLPDFSPEATTILVGMLGTPADGHAIALACQLLIHSDSMARVLHLAYLVKITHEMPLISPDAQQETIACESLEAIEQHLHDQKISLNIRVERARYPARHLLEIAREAKPLQLILALPQDASEEDAEFLKYILDHATCEVLVHRIPASQIAQKRKQ